MSSSDTTRNHNFLILCSSLILSYAWSAYLLALLGTFYWWTLWPLTLCLFIGLLKLSVTPFTSIKIPHNTLFSLLVAILVGTYIFSHFHPGSFFTGRDQGTLAYAAHLLAESGTPYTESPAISSFFEIYGAGAALNFPGFHYSATGSLIAQFPLPYISFLGGFNLLFGIHGAPIANAILVGFFLLIAGTLLRSALSNKHTLYYESIFCALILSAFPLLWFARYTLSENLALLLLLLSFTLFFFLRTKEENQTSLIVLSILSTSLLFFTRIEGVWFFGIFTLLALSLPHVRSWLASDVPVRILLPSSLFVSILCLALIISFPFYKTIASLLISTPKTTQTATQNADNAAFFYDFLLPVYSGYGLHIIILTIVLALFRVIVRDRHHRHITGLLLLLTGPLLFYFFDPQISADHPWMLRRFYYWLLPIGCFAFIYIIYTLHQKRYHLTGITLAIAFVIYNLTISSSFMTVREHAALPLHVEQIQSLLGPHDLVLIDRNASTDPWSLLPGIFTHTNNLDAVYFFNPEDYEKLKTDRFKYIHLITTVDSSERYKALTENAEDPITYTLTTEYLTRDPKATFTGLPQLTERSNDLLIYKIK